MGTQDLEDVAAEILSSARIETPVNAFEVAHALDVAVLRGDRYSYRSGVATVRASDRFERQQFGLAHELGHHVLQTLKIPDTEPAADAFAAELLMPRRDFWLASKRLGRDFSALKRRYRFASFEAIARRYARMHGLTLFVFDSPPSGREKCERVEGSGIWNSELDAFAAYAALTGERFEIDGTTTYPVVDKDAGWARVLVVV